MPQQSNVHEILNFPAEHAASEAVRRSFLHRHRCRTDAEVTPLQIRDLVEILREGHHAAAGLLPVVVLVRGVIAVLGQ